MSMPDPLWIQHSNLRDLLHQLKFHLFYIYMIRDGTDWLRLFCYIFEILISIPISYLKISYLKISYMKISYMKISHAKVS